MKVTIDLPETLHAHYTDAAERHKVSLAAFLKDRLTAAQDFPFRPVVIAPPDRAALEEIAGRQLNSGADITRLMRDCMRLDLGECHVELTMDDLTQLEQHASFYGESLQECLDRLTPDFVDFILNRA